MKVALQPHYNGLHWLYENTNGDTLSIVCHDFSYGRDEGLFEILASWEPDVRGFLTFEEVGEQIILLKKMEN